MSYPTASWNGTSVYKSNLYVTFLLNFTGSHFPVPHTVLNITDKIFKTLKQDKAQVTSMTEFALTKERRDIIPNQK